MNKLSRQKRIAVIASLVEGNSIRSTVRMTGVVEIAWDAGNLASGVYFYKLVAGSFSDTKKMVLLK
jgi:hypothetical protein